MGLHRGAPHFTSPVSVPYVRFVTSVRFRDKDKKVIHSVAFDEIIGTLQLVSGGGGFADHYVFTNAVVLRVAGAVDESDF